MVAGLPFTAGSAALAGTIASVDDGVVSLLREAGTLMIGKTNTPEFGLPCCSSPILHRRPVHHGSFPLGRGSSGSRRCRCRTYRPGRPRIRRRRLDPDSGQRVRPGRPEADPRGGVSAGPHGDVDGAGRVSERHPGRARHRRAARRPRLQPSRRRLCASRTSHTIPGSVRTRSETAPDRCADDSSDRRAGASRPAVPRRSERNGLAAGGPGTCGGGRSVPSARAVGVVRAPGRSWRRRRFRPRAPAEAATRWLRAKAAASPASNSPRPSPAYNGRPGAGGSGLRSTSSLTDTRLAVPRRRRAARRRGPGRRLRSAGEYTPWTSVWNLTGWPAISLPLHRVEVEAADASGRRHARRAARVGGHPARAVQLERARPWREALPTVRR